MRSCSTGTQSSESSSVYDYDEDAPYYDEDTDENVLEDTCVEAKRQIESSCPHVRVSYFHDSMRVAQFYILITDVTSRLMMISKEDYRSWGINPEIPLVIHVKVDYAFAGRCF